MHLHFNQCFCCTQSFRLFSGMFHLYQKLVIVCFVTTIIVTDQPAFGQNILSTSRQDYGSENNGEAVADNSMSATNPNEPTCDELRMMWRFSKRQSRSSEITNELPTYRDPFAYNVWKQYTPTTRSYEQGRQRTVAKYRSASMPVYGRVVHKPSVDSMLDLGDRGRVMDRFYVPEYNIGTPRRSSNRMGGTGVLLPSRPNQLTPQRGSFHRLKELVWTERAKELQAQRRVEENAARAAVLKSLANGARNVDNYYETFGSNFGTGNGLN